MASTIGRGKHGLQRGVQQPDSEAQTLVFRSSIHAGRKPKPKPGTTTSWWTTEGPIGFTALAQTKQAAMSRSRVANAAEPYTEEIGGETRGDA